MTAPHETPTPGAPRPRSRAALPHGATATGSPDAHPRTRTIGSAEPPTDPHRERESATDGAPPAIARAPSYVRPLIGSRAAMFATAPKPPSRRPAPAEGPAPRQEFEPATLREHAIATSPERCSNAPPVAALQPDPPHSRTEPPPLATSGAVHDRPRDVTHGPRRARAPHDAAPPPIALTRDDARELGGLDRDRCHFEQRRPERTELPVDLDQHHTPPSRRVTDHDGTSSTTDTPSVCRRPRRSHPAPSPAVTLNHCSTAATIPTPSPVAYAWSFDASTTTEIRIMHPPSAPSRALPRTPEPPPTRGHPRPNTTPPACR